MGELHEVFNSNHELLKTQEDIRTHEAKAYYQPGNRSHGCRSSVHFKGKHNDCSTDVKNNRIARYHSPPVLTLPSGLILTPTVFGYTISGTSLFDIAATTEDYGNSLVVATPTVSLRATENDPDEVSVIKFMDDYRKTIKIREGTITAGFLFNENVGKLKDNFNVAFRRLQALHRTLQKDEKKFKIYNDTFQSYIKDGITEDCDVHPTGVTSFYLPHRHVWTPGKITELRIVFDASSYGINELSLNDVIKVTLSLHHEVLLLFRTYKNTMVADIQKAFLQIRLPKDPSRCYKILMDKGFERSSRRLQCQRLVSAESLLELT
ncbi:unnamed protein product [Strongylus vulgaris]|uniref:Uncharacterized protein n=1 Tax=Strongylus vulgaris TaxID=40348 RepID=A0A3P7J970_STRVU|nr:unnamed protein product [Strongylus vulgaris]